MPVQDWTLVEAGIFHDHHLSWLAELQRVLNTGVLPADHYALVEQHAGRSLADMLRLPTRSEQSSAPALPGIAVADTPPYTKHNITLAPTLLALRRSLAIRHVSAHRLVALIEVVSPANKDREQRVESFAAKMVAALDAGVHVLLLDLFPPGTHDPQGLDTVIRQRLEQSESAEAPPAGEPLTLASYAAGPQVNIYLEHLAVGAPLPEMPLFLRPDRYINVPLEATYQSAYRGMPAFWRDVLEGRPPAGW